ncbi:IkappaB kinase complex, IKAP component [Suhomyces tanzawaensis NRRL Y-17324]|uniref:Elongator complex protein 1 n=1 Tax=Suhomyces tanzawaensis NRRL Y-17324 TaxID=984487 RepID=A0A1E4SHW7_9ASCO|nr:IkappaB kinase complex, IKAP component [Suhomyces tanzawaensis NRRL Y-17324]ODV79037.1 IkappaB kinase complex, IKAP component [Suhomyces tanzawaensis NRRL Y-17324]
MRNLTILNRGYISTISKTYPDLEIIDSVFDPVADSITYVLSSEESSLIEVQQFTKTGQENILASFNISSPISPTARLLSFNHFVDTCQLVFVLENGDIILATYDSMQPDCDTTVVEIVGSIDVGLNASMWSPDEETLSILTKENKLILLSRLFEPICEKELDSNDIKITDSKHVSVGWGKKETQFKGRGFKAMEREKEATKDNKTLISSALEREKDALKHAGLDLKEDGPLKDPTVSEVERGTLSSFDPMTNRISWRGDGEFFAVTTIEPVLVQDTDELFDRRVIRVFSRKGELDSINEACDGLEHNLSWKPQGSLIATTKRGLDEDGDLALELAFFERNGLRHGQFNTRLDPDSETVSDLQWSSDSEILLLQMTDRIQLWTTKNYHWYLKQEIYVAPQEQINFAKFHPEKPLHLMIAKANGLEIIDLTYKIVSGPTCIGQDVGMTLVTDGNTMKITPLAIANVPPPISFREFDVSGSINDLAVSKSNEIYAISTSNSEIHLASLKLDEMKKGKSPKLRSTISSDLLVSEEGEFLKQIAFVENQFIAALVDGHVSSKIVLFNIENLEEPLFEDIVEIPTKVIIIKAQANFEALAIEGIDGTIYQLDQQKNLREVGRFPQLCRDFELVVTEALGDHATSADDYFEKVTPFGISSNGKLYANDIQIATAVTSIKTTESHLLFTTAQSQLCFVHLSTTTGDFQNAVFQSTSTENVTDERIRQIERGSILVNAMPSNYSVVLEAPRGNLETICPRIMVLSGVRKFIKLKEFKKAFLACRTHRIDLDILHDYDPQLFFNNLENFVNQIKNVGHLDLFVSCLHDEDVTLTKYKETLNESAEISEVFEKLQLEQLSKLQDSATEQNSVKKIIKNREDNKVSSKINKICEGILSILLKPEYFETYLQTIITAYACQKPPNLQDALKLIGSFDNQDQVEQTVTHLCFLQDVNKLYNVALGLYDVKLTLSIAQQSQKDPKEYLPFLQNLHTQPELRRKFSIDDHLKNNEKALGWLHELGSASYEEFDDYVVNHELYQCALSIYRYDDSRSNQIYKLYGSHLADKQLYSEAGLVYEYLNDFQNALKNYISAKRWREALSLLQRAELQDGLRDSAEQLSSSLVDDHKYSEAAEIEFNFLGNIEEAVKLYCKSYLFDSAILLASKEKRPELIESIVDVQLGEGFGTIAELLVDCKSQMTSQLRRLRELRAKKQEDPYAFYGVPNDDMDTPDNVSVAASETSTTPSFFTRYTGKTSGTAKTGASRRTTKNRKREERKKAKGRKGTIYEEEYLIKSVGRLVERLDQTESDAIKLIEGLIRRSMKEQAYQIQKSWVDLIDFIKENVDEIHNMSEKDRERVDDNGEVYLIPEIPAPSIREFPRKNILDY